MLALFITQPRDVYFVPNLKFKKCTIIEIRRQRTKCNVRKIKFPLQLKGNTRGKTERLPIPNLTGKFTNLI